MGNTSHIDPMQYVLVMLRNIEVYSLDLIKATAVITAHGKVLPLLDPNNPQTMRLLNDLDDLAAIRTTFRQLVFKPTTGETNHDE